MELRDCPEVLGVSCLLPLIVHVGAVAQEPSGSWLEHSRPPRSVRKCARPTQKACFDPAAGPEILHLDAPPAI